MRYEGPFVGNVIIDDAYALVVPVVFLDNLAVEFRQGVAGEGLPFFNHFMHAQFKFCELSLAENGSLNTLQIVPEQRKPSRVILGVLEGVIDE